jgi:mRNA interferase YafQ
VRIVERSNQFKKDVELLRKQGKQLSKLKYMMELLIEGKSLPLQYKDHPLRGNWIGSRDCHIESDWILIYTSTSKSIRFERTGSHSELF